MTFLFATTAALMGVAVANTANAGTTGKVEVIFGETHCTGTLLVPMTNAHSSIDSPTQYRFLTSKSKRMCRMITTHYNDDDDDEKPTYIA